MRASVQPWSIAGAWSFVGAGDDPQAMPAAERIPLSIRWGLVLFAFLMPFESVVLPIFPNNLSLPRIAAVLVLGSCLLHVRYAYSRPHPAFFCFGAYLLIHYVRGAIAYNDLLAGAFVRPLLIPLQLVLFAWLIGKPLRNPKLAIRTLVAFCIGSIIVAAGMIFKVPGFSKSIETKGIERVTALGSDPNVLATLFSLAIVILIGLLLGKHMVSKAGRILLGSFGLFLPAAIVLTGSRTGLVALLAGVAMYVMPVGRIKLLHVAFVLCCLGGLMVYVVSDPLFMSRLSRTVDSNDVSGRDRILENSLLRMAERPIAGWGPVRWQRVLDGKDAHNLYIYLVLEVGLIGAIPYLLGLLFCFLSVWRSRNSDLGQIYLAIFALLFVANLGVNFRFSKPMWFFIAGSLVLYRLHAGAKLPATSLYRPVRARIQEYVR